MNDIAILVVEDNSDHLELIVSALAEKIDRTRIATAVDGAQALDFLLARGPHAERDVRKQPRLVIMDLKMAPMDGLQTLKAMRADSNTSSVPVVMLSGSSDKQELDSCYAAGANSVVRKSLDFDELRTKMARVYDFWLTVNEANRHSRV
ncbi:MAG TPA: response regulator [Ramlibacter sp.]|uniref:response regulator n=1 Tax=Ramlibacter sp. TaxID=1917967 RepID=UPI002CB716B5|nr:response regulator [Ramlibacter sp.]HVZ46262.1 response regulator [Ramlibacter sp.]